MFTSLELQTFSSSILSLFKSNVCRGKFLTPNVFCFFVLFYSVLIVDKMSLSRLFHSYRDEPIGRWGETGVHCKNHLTQPQVEHGLSHMWPVRGSNLRQSQRRDDRMIKSAPPNALSSKLNQHSCFLVYRFKSQKNKMSDELQLKIQMHLPSRPYRGRLLQEYF